MLQESSQLPTLKVIFTNSYGAITAVELPVGETFGEIYESLPQIFMGIGFHPETVKEFFDDE